jgi:hypothetical protein
MLLKQIGGSMGSELRCKVRSNGKEARGKALLETNEIIFRGEMRLKIPLVSLKSVVARGGDLLLKWPEGSAVFELGDHAEKWAHNILHPKSTLEKLGIKPGLVISTLGMADGNFAKDVRRTAGSFSDAKPLRNSDLIFFGAEKAAELVRAGKLASSLASAGALWIVYRKGKQEITEQQVLDAGRRAGFVDVKVVSFSATHTALKFVQPKAKRDLTL